ncbi:MAG: family 16 glycosylhydrolase [Bacilli bacterium]|nr:family 16 glycosylhydrolase [Bacilli bacterium]MBN2877857.1 family 16 glycosylhydrolase [Bacilli bacterium]
MKKLTILIGVLLLVFLIGCQTTGSNTETTTNSQSTTTGIDTGLTTSLVYDNRSLVPDSCSALENIGDWQPVWCDEFDYEGLPNSDLWTYDTGGGGWGNGEAQYYTNADPDNAYVSDGTLKITALKESLLGSEYTSARLVSKYKGDWLYGKIQIKAKLPSGDGTWPAIWMLPTDWEYGGWPDSGEIDIMEHVGADPYKVYGTLHTGAYNHNLGTQIGYSKTVNDAESAFHVYEIEWEPAHMEVFVDGVSYGTFGYNPTLNVNIDNEDAWPFDQRFHLILNLAIGGSWGGAIDDSIFPQSLEIDYVRVYQKDYAGMDQAAPDAVTDLTLLDQGEDSIKVTWDKATDDVLVKEYEIYVDSAKVGSTSLNAFRIENLLPNTQYTINVVAVDFAGNRSEMTALSASTKSVRTILGVIQAESYDYSYGVYRQTTADIEGDQDVTDISTDDYMEYTLSVPESGTYTLTLRVASEAASQIKLYRDNLLLPVTTIEIPATGGSSVYADVVSSNFSLTEGLYTFKIKATVGGFILNYFEFKKVD